MLNAPMSWCKFGATLYRAILTIFTISNGTLKTRRDNLCGISCGVNNSCRTPRIALQFSKARIYFDIQKALCHAGLFVFIRIILSIVGVDVLGDPNERQPSGTPGRSSPTKSGRAVQFVKTLPSYLLFAVFMV